jgi:hypothetical protein
VRDLQVEEDLQMQEELEAVERENKVLSRRAEIARIREENQKLKEVIEVAEEHTEEVVRRRGSQEGCGARRRGSQYPVELGLPRARLPDSRPATGRAARSKDGADEENLNLDYLRSVDHLRPQVEARQKEIDLWGESRHNGGEEERDSTSKGKKPVSGRIEKPEAGVYNPVIWPHTRLEFRHSGACTFDKLDFALLVAGEASLLSDFDRSEEERRARLQLIKLVAYYSRYFDWSLVREYYAAILSEVERSRDITRAWSRINFTDIASSTLFAPAAYGRGQNFQSQQVGVVASGGNFRGSGRGGYRGGRRGSSGNSSRRYFCSAYNREECEHNGSHWGTIGGRNCYLEHFCASCYLNSKEVNFVPENKCDKHKKKN